MSYEDYGYKPNSNVIYKCTYHVVWCPKYRRSVLSEEIGMRLKEVANEVSQEFGFDIVEMEVMPDHFHMIVDVDPQFGIHRDIKRVKGKSSRVLREEFPELRSKIPTLWTNSYFVTTTGGVPLEVVKKYIENQKNT